MGPLLTVIQSSIFSTKTRLLNSNLTIKNISGYFLDTSVDYQVELLLKQIQLDNMMIKHFFKTILFQTPGRTEQEKRQLKGVPVLHASTVILKRKKDETRKRKVLKVEDT